MAVDPVRDAGGRLQSEAAAAYVAELFDRHGRMVYAVCRLLLRDRHEAEDAAQQTFLSAHRSILEGTEPRDPSAWLGTIARNECRSRIRARMTEPLVALRDDEAGPGDVEHLAAQREEVEALCAALAELPSAQRDAVVLREFYGLSYEEVSAALGVTGPAVDSLLVRARRRLQETLRPARVASGLLVLPAGLRDSLAEALPGFAPSSGAGLLAKVASLPLAAKLAGAAATVAVVGSAGSVGYRHADVLPSAPEPARAKRPVEREVSLPEGQGGEPLLVFSAAEPAEREEREDRSGQGGRERDEDDDERERDGPEWLDRSGPGDGDDDAEEHQEEEDRSGEDSGSDSGESDSGGSGESGESDDD